MTSIDVTTTDARGPLRPAGGLDDLRRRVVGEVLVPGDRGHDDRCLAWNRLVAHRPAVIVVAADVGDVVTAVQYAAEQELGLGVQATGHGMALPVDGVLVDTSALTDVIVEPQSRTAWVSAGCTWGPVLAAAQQHGLAPLLGSSMTVGAVGYTLGGGLGWLARRFGAACDAVRSFEVVTADGRLLRACPDENPELFAALRGGGGGAFGIVTGMEIDLFAVETVYAGKLLYPAEAAGEVFERFAEWVRVAPDELTAGLALINFPPLPEVPEAVRGRSFTIVRGCWSGAIDEGRRLLDEWRSVLPPLVDMWHEMPFSDCASISDDPVDPLPAVTTGGWLRVLDRTVGEVMAAHAFPVGGPPALLVTEVRHVGGAVSRGGQATSAMGNRDEQFAFHVVAVPMHHDPATIAVLLQDLKVALGDAVAAGTYLNFVGHDERRDRSSDGVDPGCRAALADLAATLDPANLLRYGVDHRPRQRAGGEGQSTTIGRSGSAVHSLSEPS